MREKMRLGTVLLLLCGLITPICAQILYHQKIAVGLGNVSAGLLGENGHVAFTAITAVGEYYDPWLGGQPYLPELMIGERDTRVYGLSTTGSLLWGFTAPSTGSIRHAFAGATDLSSAVGSSAEATGAGFDASGTPVWWDGTNLYRGTTDFSTPILGSGTRSVTKVIVNSAGEVGWTGGGPNTAGYFDAFYESTNVSGPVLGPGFHIGNVNTVGFGKTGWSGSGGPLGSNQDAFSGSTNVTQGILGNNRSAGAYGINPIGTILWTGTGSATGLTADVYVGTNNISQQALGTGSRSAYPIELLPGGTAFWRGQSTAMTNGQFDVFSGTTNVSATPLGSGRLAQGLGINNDGYAIWFGIGSNTTNRYNVFMGSNNLTLLATGTKSRQSVLLTMNKAGQVLWATSEPDFTYTVWLTTPFKPTTLSGKINLSGIANPSVHTVRMDFHEPGTGTLQFSLDVAVDGATGAYSTSIPIPGLFDIRLKIDHFLSRFIRGVPCYVESHLDVTMPNGDADHNNHVDLFDLNYVLVRFAESGQGLQADLNENELVDLFDLNAVLIWFGAVGE